MICIVRATWRLDPRTCEVGKSGKFRPLFSVCTALTIHAHVDHGRVVNPPLDELLAEKVDRERSATIGMGVACVAAPSRKVVTWLILPVVICLSQRLSHACL